MGGTGKVSLEEGVEESEKQSLSRPPEALVRADKPRLLEKSERISISGCKVGCVGEVCGAFYGKASLGKLWVLIQAPSTGTPWDHCWSGGTAAGKVS